MTAARKTGAAPAHAAARVAKPADDAADDDIAGEFAAAVSMSATELARWLETDDSKAVGWTHEGETESVGHDSGRHIVRLLKKARRDFDAADLAHMRKVVGYVHRHLAQRPHGDITETRWRYSLMNWGHDPAK